ncbi:methyltransferase-like protein 27 isoform X1 [Cygnus atratus]|uniref:methyltransferase-like protein 27 isoform X1 n=1 Tax=Cygnus atratus TaxID=8868 RepID=UPI0015D61318|nr:methyltransferase-like protein 27 isoform X1 [Cygnus atratus]
MLPPAGVRERVRAVHGGAALPELLRRYDGWAGRYEQDVAALEYRAPHLAAASLAFAFPAPPAGARVLDVGCGTGLVARELQRRGFGCLHGVDGSAGMLERARGTGLYRQLQRCVLGREPLPGPAEHYDAVTVVGALSEGQVPCSALPELLRVTKPGEVAPWDVVPMGRVPRLGTGMGRPGRGLVPTGTGSHAGGPVSWVQARGRGSGTRGPLPPSGDTAQRGPRHPVPCPGRGLPVPDHQEQPLEPALQGGAGGSAAAAGAAGGLAESPGPGGGALGEGHRGGGERPGHWLHLRRGLHLSQVPRPASRGGLRAETAPGKGAEPGALHDVTLHVPCPVQPCHPLPTQQHFQSLNFPIPFPISSPRV